MQVVRKSEMKNSAPVPGMAEFAVGRDLGARGVWLARITASTGTGMSPVHHHRDSEALVCVLAGTVTFVYGTELRDRIDLRAGDFLFIPAWTLHAEGNLGPEPVEMVMARSTPEPIAEFHPEIRVPEAVLHAHAVS